jgi:hypothetical protein
MFLPLSAKEEEAHDDQVPGSNSLWAVTSSHVYLTTMLGTYFRAY